MASVTFSVQGGRGKIFEILRREVARPFHGRRGEIAATAMRRTSRFSVAEQFARQTTISAKGSMHLWVRSKPFGNRPAPEKTLHRTGAYMRAWTGEGTGSITRTTDTSVSIGVDRSLFPQAGIFQANAPTRVRAKKKAKDGKPSMYYFLGLHYGVWIKPAKLLVGLRIPHRPVRVNQPMIVDVGRRIVAAITQDSRAQRGAKA